MHGLVTFLWVITDFYQEVLQYPGTWWIQYMSPTKRNPWRTTSSTGNPFLTWIQQWISSITVVDTFSEHIILFCFVLFYPCLIFIIRRSLNKIVSVTSSKWTWMIFDVWMGIPCIKSMYKADVCSTQLDFFQSPGLRWWTRPGAWSKLHPLPQCPILPVVLSVLNPCLFVLA